MNRMEEYQELRTRGQQTPDALAGAAARAKRRVRLRRRITRPAAALAGALALFTVMVNLSPAFAASVAKVPLLGDLAQLVSLDRGLKDAIESEYVQLIDQAQTAGGVTLRLPYLVADSHRLVLFVEKNGAPDSLSALGLWGPDGQELPCVTSGFNQQPNGLDSITYDLLNLDMPRELTARFSLTEQDQADFSFDLRLDVPAPPRVFPIHQELTVQDQRLTVEQMTVYPTAIQVEVAYDPQNTAQLSGLDFDLVDETGQVWSHGRGLIAFGGDDPGRQTYLLESNYFHRPESLTLRLNALRMLDRDKEWITLDLNTGKMTPNDPDIRLVSAVPQGDEVILGFERAPDQLISTFSGTYQDSAGREHYIDSMSSSGTDDRPVTATFRVKRFADGIVRLNRSWAPLTQLDSPLEIPVPGLE